ncbi:MAG: Coenzyme F420 hydrogenase/dehydrogenase, beta subunit C-terminal domain [Candidatus Bathyarchaeia archaeon]
MREALDVETVSKPKLFGSLITEVLNPGLCSFCGACVASCPVYILQMQGEKPTMRGKCILCQVCYYSCSSAGFPSDEVEKEIFGRTRNADEPIGIYESIANGRSTKQEILKKGQDGGVVTSILGCALESGKVDAAVVTGVDGKVSWKAVPCVALDYSDLLNAAGTKYTASPALIGLMSAVQEYGRKNVAVVGTPCQMRSYRRMETSYFGARRLAGDVALAIGLFCMEAYGHDQLLGEYVQSKSIDLSQVTRFEIKKGKFKVYVKDAEALVVPLKEIKQFARSSCHACEDFTAEFADISVGGVGCPEGWSTVIARTKRGQEFLSDAEKNGWLELRPIDPGKEGMEQVLKLSITKRTGAQKPAPPPAQPATS